MQALLQLSTPALNLQSLQRFYDEIEKHIRSLTALGVTHDTYGPLLVSVLLGKLPQDIRKNLARENHNTEWTLDQVRQALLKEIKLLEAGVEFSLTEVPYSTQPAAPIPTASFFTATQGAQTQGAQPREKKRACAFCKGSHSPRECKVEHDQKMDIVKREHLCFNCLGKHKISQCKSKIRCKCGGRKHHTSICSGEPSRTSSASEPPVPAQSVSHLSAASPPFVPPSGQTPQKAGTVLTTLTPVTSCHASETSMNPNHNISLLKTAIAVVTTDDRRAEANILFDEGAQRSFITKQLAKDLHLRTTRSEDVTLAAFGAKGTAHNKLELARIYLQSDSGQGIPLDVLVVPRIATPLQNRFRGSISNIPHLQGLKLAHQLPTTRTLRSLY